MHLLRFKKIRSDSAIVWRTIGLRLSGKVKVDLSFSHSASKLTTHNVPFSVLQLWFNIRSHWWYIEFTIHQCAYTESGYDRECGVLNIWTAVLISVCASQLAFRQSPRHCLFMTVSHPVMFSVLSLSFRLNSEFPFWILRPRTIISTLNSSDQ